MVAFCTLFRSSTEVEESSISNSSSSSSISSSLSVSSSTGSEGSDPSTVGCKVPLRARVTFVGPSSTTTNDFCLSRSFHFRVREIAWNQSVDCLSAHTVGNGYFDALILIWSPSVLEPQREFGQCKADLRFSSTRPRPSNEAHAVLRELYGTQILSSMLSGSNIGRKESVWGQMGLMRIAGISGWTREPPAESFHMISIFNCNDPRTNLTEYAVDPVGVATHRPSACTVVM